MKLVRRSITLLFLWLGSSVLISGPNRIVEAAESDDADFVNSLNHKTGFSRKNSTAPEIPQQLGKLNVIQKTVSLILLDLAEPLL